MMNAVTDAAVKPRRSHWRRYGILYAVIAMCIAPVVASYLAYYVFPPSGRTNYGTLLEPRPMPAQPLPRDGGPPFSFDELAGRWVLVAAAGGACDAPCRAALLQMRQQRLMAGKEMDRIERVWLVTDAAPVAPELLRAYEGMHVVRAPVGVIDALQTAPDDGGIEGHVFVVDPMGNLMLRWPLDPEPQRVKKDLARLLTASSHWVRVPGK